MHTLFFFIALALCASARAQSTTGATSRDNASPMQAAEGGGYVIKTSSLGKGVKGFKGTTPLAVTVRGDSVVSIKPLRNRETPEYFEQAQGMLRAWEGLPVEAALALEVDAVTGATLSCEALRENVRLALDYYMQYRP